MMIGDRSNLHCRTGGDLAQLKGKNIFSFWFFALAFILGHLVPQALITIYARCLRMHEI